jgi:hypothetical protein
MMEKGLTLEKTKSVAQIGEEIGLELGNNFVKAYQVANPTDVHYYVVGRSILDQILAQPGCAGIKFLNAYNEMGEKTLVYVGVDANGQVQLDFSVVTAGGELSAERAIVADRVRTGAAKPASTTLIDGDSIDDGSIYIQE